MSDNVSIEHINEIMDENPNPIDQNEVDQNEVK